MQARWTSASEIDSTTRISCAARASDSNSRHIRCLLIGTSTIGTNLPTSQWSSPHRPSAYSSTSPSGSFDPRPNHRQNPLRVALFSRVKCGAVVLA
eukprot:437120-Rhodomonas_salina.6